MLDQAKEIRPGEDLDWKMLESYLKESIPDIQGEMSVAQFHGGHANLTYLVSFGDQDLIVRRPPFGKIAPGAHDMKREFKVLSKLYKFFPRAPRAFHYCDDEKIIGAPFVVMERRTGVVVRIKLLDCFSSFENVEERLTDAMVKAIVDLHLVDYKQAELSDLGKPEGYLDRQLNGWLKRWELSKTEENSDMSWVGETLIKSKPEPQRISIIHNDIKLDNCQFQSDNPDEVSSMFDWDMCTLGDPLADLGNTLVYHKRDQQQDDKLPFTLKGNFPTQKFLIDKYTEYSGLNLDNMNWYLSFAYMKGAVIMQQLYKRYVDGATKDKRMSQMGMVANQMARLAKETVIGEL